MIWPVWWNMLSIWCGNRRRCSENVVFRRIMKLYRWRLSITMFLFLAKWWLGPKAELHLLRISYTLKHTLEYPNCSHTCFVIIEIYGLIFFNQFLSNTLKLQSQAVINWHILDDKFVIALVPYLHFFLKLQCIFAFSF